MIQSIQDYENWRDRQYDLPEPDSTTPDEHATYAYSHDYPDDTKLESKLNAFRYPFIIFGIKVIDLQSFTLSAYADKGMIQMYRLTISVHIVEVFNIGINLLILILLI